MEVAAEHLGSMPSGAQPPLARQLLEMIARLPFASDRCNAFAKVAMPYMPGFGRRPSACFLRRSPGMHHFAG